MASSVVLTVKVDETQAVMQTLLQKNATKDREVALELSRFFKDLANKRVRGVVDIQTGSAAPVAASATLTLVSAIATDVAIIGPTTLTASSTPANENQWEIDGADDTADALSLATAINAHSTLSQAVTASSAAGVVTVTAKQKGVSGNHINISSPDSTITASAANLGSGTGGVTEAASSYNLGIT